MIYVSACSATPLSVEMAINTAFATIFGERWSDKIEAQRAEVDTVLPVEAYRACAAHGMSKYETAECLGVSRSAVGVMAIRHGLTFRDGRGRPKCAA
jgi:hypothetical protein